MITMAVFFPALMGAGILVSGALLLWDAVRRLMPNRGQRRRYRIAVGTFGVIANVARTVGVRMDPPSFLTRRSRSNTTYVLVAVLSVCLGSVALSTGLDAYEDPIGVFYGSPWAIGLGVFAFAALVVAGGIALTLVFLESSNSAVLTWIVEHSPYGHLAVPSRTGARADIRKDES